MVSATFTPQSPKGEVAEDQYSKYRFSLFTLVNLFRLDSFMNQNNAFIIIMTMKKNYNYVVRKVPEVFADVKLTTRLKRFMFRFISVAGKWKYQD